MPSSQWNLYAVMADMQHTKMGGCGIHKPSTINKLLLTFININDSISAFWRSTGNLVHPQTGVFLICENGWLMIQVFRSSTKSKY